MLEALLHGGLPATKLGALRPSAAPALVVAITNLADELRTFRFGLASGLTLHCSLLRFFTDPSSSLLCWSSSSSPLRRGPWALAEHRSKSILADEAGIAGMAEESDVNRGELDNILEVVRREFSDVLVDELGPSAMARASTLRLITCGK